MALVAIEGFEFYETQQNLALKYPFGHDGTISFTAGRMGQTALNIPIGNNKFSLMPLSSCDTYVIGFAVKFSGTLGFYPGFVKFCQDHVTHLSLNQNTNGTLTLLSQSFLGTTTNSIVGDYWNYIEIKFYIHPTEGYVNLFVNGSQWLSIPLCNSYNPASPTRTVNQITWSNLSTTSTSLQVDDVYVLQNTTTSLGSVFIESRVPDSTVLGEWDLIGSNHQDSEKSADGDTSYLRGTTDGTSEIYALLPLTGSNSVKAVDFNFLARRESGGGLVTLTPIVREGSTDYPIDSFVVPTSYNYINKLMLTDPSTSGSWTTSGVNSHKFGFRR